MNKFATIAALATLSACSQAAPAPTMEEIAGTYDYTMSDGTTGDTVMTLDGAYTDTENHAEGNLVETGTWGVPKGEVCFDPEGNDSAKPNRCYVLSEPDAEGGQTATMADGSVVEVKKRPAA